MTVKDDLHALIEQMEEADARELLDYVQARGESDAHPDQAFRDRTFRAMAESDAGGGVWIPQESVLAWVQAWDTPDEAAADEQFQALRARLREQASDNPAA